MAPDGPRWDNILNFRDVGESVNQACSSDAPPRLRVGCLYRSARLDEASSRDRGVLVNELGVKTIVDLRSNTEHINAAKKHSSLATLVQPGLVPMPKKQFFEPLKISGPRYEEINLNGKGFERALVWKLSYYSLARMLCLMALGM
jgi:protein-tyrosine phosphatase